MKHRVLSLAVVLAVGAAQLAQENWHPYSQSQSNAFMADIDSIAVSDDITSVRVATTPRAGPAGDYSHSVETYEFRCGSNQWRTAGMVEYGPDGAEAGRYPEEGAAWEDVRANTAPEYLKNIVCDGARAQPPVWPTIKDYVDAGRS